MSSIVQQLFKNANKLNTPTLQIPKDFTLTIKIYTSELYVILKIYTVFKNKLLDHQKMQNKFPTFSLSPACNISLEVLKYKKKEEQALKT